MSKALIIIDMLNDFVNEDGALYVQGAQEIVPNINKLIKKFDGHIIFVNDSHDEDDIEFKIWPVHAVAGSLGSLTHFNIRGLHEVKTTLFTKKDLSMFSNPQVFEFLEENFIDELYITGVATDYCIVNTVLNSKSKTGGGIDGATYMGYKVNIVVDAIAGVDEITGVPRTKGKVAESLIKMGAAGANTAYTEDIINDQKS